LLRRGACLQARHRWCHGSGTTTTDSATIVMTMSDVG